MEENHKLGMVAADQACQSISLVLPAWNEADALPRAVREADAALGAVAAAYEIIVVDDGSSDDTARVTRELAARFPSLRLVQHGENRGYGAALRSGFAAARCELVMFTDADSQFDLSELDRFLLLARHYDVVCGYRIDRQDSPLRCLYSRVYNQFVRALLGTGVRDVDCAFKVFRRTALRELEITTDGFLVNAEMLTQARQKRLAIVEVGVSHRPRVEGQTTVSPWHIPVVFASLLRFWWNRVQCPAPDSGTAGGRFASGQGSEKLLNQDSWSQDPWWLRPAQALVLLFAALFLLLNLGYPLIGRDETRYAEIPREMLVTGDWILPQLNFRPYYDKPPLFYWLTAVSYEFFGVSERAARIVPALSGLATIVATMWLGSRMFGRRVGLWSAVILFLSVGFLVSSRVMLIDGLLTLLMTLSFASAYQAIRGPRLRYGWWLAAAGACGLALLTKGPVALVLLVPAVAAYTWLTAGSARPRWFDWLLLSGVAGAVAIPWFILVAWHDNDFLSQFVYVHHLQRFAGAFHEQPFWFFFPVLMIAGHPWTFFTIPLAQFLFGRSEDHRRLRSPALGYLILWSGWCFLFFSMSRCKLASYILPVAPPLSIALGYYLDQLLFAELKGPLTTFARRWSAWLSGGATCIATIAFCAYGGAAGIESYGVSTMLIATCTILFALVVLARQHELNAFAGCGIAGALMFLFAGAVVHRGIPQFAAGKTILAPGSLWRDDLDRVGDVPLVTVASEWSEVPFYLRSRDVLNFPELNLEALGRFAADKDRFVMLLRSVDDISQLKSKFAPLGQLELIRQERKAHLLLVTPGRDRRTAARPEPGTPPPVK